MIADLKPYPAMKDSGLPWPGETPARRRAPDGINPGYSISFARYFYKPQPLRPLEEIRAGILALEKETEGLLDEIIGGGEA